MASPFAHNGTAFNIAERRLAVIAATASGLFFFHCCFQALAFARFAAAQRRDLALTTSRPCSSICLAWWTPRLRAFQRFDAARVLSRFLLAHSRYRTAYRSLFAACHAADSAELQGLHRALCPSRDAAKRWNSVSGFTCLHLVHCFSTIQLYTFLVVKGFKVHRL